MHRKQKSILLLVHLLVLALDLRTELNIGPMCLLEIFNCISVNHLLDYPMRGQKTKGIQATPTN